MRMGDINVVVTSKDGEVLDNLSTIGDGQGQFLLARVEEDQDEVRVLLKGCTNQGNLVMIAGSVLESLQDLVCRDMGINLPLGIIAMSLVEHIECHKEHTILRRG